jgi:hypothetical protein
MLAPLGCNVCDTTLPQPANAISPAQGQNSSTETIAMQTILVATVTPFVKEKLDRPRGLLKRPCPEIELQCPLLPGSDLR